TLADLLTIKTEKGRLDNLTIGFCGDLKYGRTVHSLIMALSRYKNIKIVLISPDELKLPSYVKTEILDAYNMPYIETASLEDSLADLDVLYMTRIQQERFDDREEYERLKDSYLLNLEKLNKAKKDTIVLHPLPRVNEISVDVDGDCRACYFKQVLNGKYMRMALILKLLDSVNEKNNLLSEEGLIYGEYKCTNEKCITKTEQELKQISKINGDGTKRCYYCEKEVE
ncbi:MAG: aspartate carbamoyltransferase, partial [Clostridia bacterium]|nr:aspartate carbamoyltransferase [Clostridia bacterium]